jgi:predicted SAM-dependent methyltransferase
MSDHATMQALAPTRLNIGCGEWPLLYWTNIDESQNAYADIYQHVPPLPYGDNTLSDIYAGHFLEHLTQDDAGAFLDECWRCLKPGGRLGVLVPDTREILRRYIAGADDKVEWPQGSYVHVSDLDDVCRMFLYSTVQESHHRWSYDLYTLRRLLMKHRFNVTAEIDRHSDPRIPVGAWYQCGWDAVKPV